MGGEGERVSRVLEVWVRDRRVYNVLKLRTCSVTEVKECIEELDDVKGVKVIVYPDPKRPHFKITLSASSKEGLLKLLEVWGRESG